MNKFISFLFCLTYIGAIIYGFGALAAWDINPANWNKYWRGFTAICAFFAFCFIHSQLFPSKSKEQS